MSAGPSEYELVRAGRIHSAWIRPVIAIPIQAAALLVTPADELGTALLVLAGVGAWLVLMAAVLRRGPAPWLLPLDTAVLSTLCLLQGRLDDPGLVVNECGWVMLAAQIGMISHPWEYDRRRALLAGVVISAAYCSGAAEAGFLSTPELVITTAWLPITAALSRQMRSLMLQTARRTDRASAANERARREIEVADALRASEAAHLATLHDTVAATLLMVGMGASPAGDRLRQQASRDLAVLTASPAGTGGSEVAGGEPDATTGLGDALAPVIRSAEVEAGLVQHGPVTVVPAQVKMAFVGAVGEALRNVARHAPGRRAAVELDTRGDTVLVSVRDDGTGFAPGATPGRGIRHSIVGRLDRVGGRAEVTSSGAGVVVVLEWSPAPAMRAG